MTSPFCTKPELKKLTGTDNAKGQIDFFLEMGIEPIGDDVSRLRREDVMTYMAGGKGNAIFANYEDLNKLPISTKRSAADMALSEIYTRHKRRATKVGIKWDLTKIEIASLITRADGRCEVTGVEFSNHKIGSSNRRPYTPSIDRIDSSKGYTLNNCRLVCVATNLAMNEWGEEVLVVLARSMKENGKI